MSSDSDQKRVSFNEIAQALNKGIVGADPSRAERLERLQTVRRAKTTVMERERARLSQKLGAEHPRVMELTRKIQVNQGLVRDLSAEVVRARTEVPQADKSAWILYGHVRNKKLEGVPNLTVALYDAKGNWIEQVGYACTDTNGHYKIVYRLGKETVGIAPGASPGDRPTEGPQVFIHVLDQQRRHLYVDKEPLMPQLGHVDVREIILDGDAGTCIPPEPPTQPTPGPPQPEPGTSLATGGPDQPIDLPTPSSRGGKPSRKSGKGKDQ